MTTTRELINRKAKQRKKANKRNIIKIAKAQWRVTQLAKNPNFTYKGYKPELILIATG